MEQTTNPTSHAAVKLKYFTLATETPANESNNLAIPTTRINPSTGFRNRTYWETLLPKIVMVHSFYWESSGVGMRNLTTKRQDATKEIELCELRRGIYL